MTLQVKAWSPSRVEKYTECPLKVKLEDLIKMCPVCFKGKVKGGFNGEPVVCDTCDDPQPEREALDRGNRLDFALTHFLGQGDARPPTAQVEVLDEATRHPKVAALVKKFRKTKNLFTQYRIAISRNWNVLKEDPDRGIWPAGVWGRVVLDVLHLTPKLARIVDWKSGNIDKKTGEIRERPGYTHSMRAYQAVVLSALPQPAASAEMVFLDAPPKLAEPFKSLPVLKRSELKQAQQDWERKIEPMMSDTVFAPRPGFYCSWCPWSKDKGGPCPNSGQRR